MRAKLPLLALSGLALALAAGCTATRQETKEAAGEPYYHDPFVRIGAYCEDRLLDLVDIVGIKILAGGGVKAGIGIGPYRSPASVGWYNYSKYGFEGRAAGIWQESGGELIFPLEHEITAREGNRGLFENVDEYYDIVAASENVSSYREYPLNRYRNYGDIQVTAFPFFVGVEANISPVQIGDFILGWLTIDIVQDDHASRLNEEEVEDERGLADLD